MPTKRPPNGLETGGKTLWKSVFKGYQFRPDELVVLEDSCRTTDIIDAMEKAWTAEGRPMTTCGSMGQLVVHPLIAELRQYRAARAALLRQLKLPDEGTGSDFGGALSAKNRTAANARWSRPGIPSARLK